MKEKLIAKPRKAKDSKTWWMGKAEEFARRYLGTEANLGSFNIPELPWGSAIPIFDPGLTNLEMLHVLKAAIPNYINVLDVGRYSDVNLYSGFEANPSPSLCFIADSQAPDYDTMDKSSEMLRGSPTKKWLTLREYGLAMALYRFATGTYLDIKTHTLFPNNYSHRRGVATGFWNEGYEQVWFSWTGKNESGFDFGARQAVYCI